MSDTTNIPGGVGTVTTQPVARTGQPAQAGQGAPAAAPTSTQATITPPLTVPSWVVTENQGNSDLLADARQIYAGELAYYYLSSVESSAGH